MDEEQRLEQFVLAALVDGYRARAGAKERFQALSEYEIARRLGIDEYSYVEFDSSSERGEIRSALSRLQRQGLARALSVSGRYETFLPTDAAVGVASAREASAANGDLPRPVVDLPEVFRFAHPVPGSGRPRAPDQRPRVETRISAEPLPTTFEARLEEIVRLLRSIDARLARLELHGGESRRE